MSSKSIAFALSRMLIFLFLMSPTLQAITWTGGGNGISWDDPNNWDSSTVPGSNDHVRILTDSVVIRSGTAGLAKSLLINGITAVLTLESTASLTITLASNTGLELANGRIHNLGDIIIDKPFGIGLKISSSSQLQNYATLEITNSQNTGIHNNGYYQNLAMASLLLKNIAGSSSVGMLNTGVLINSGSITIDNVENNKSLQSVDSLINNGLVHIKNTKCTASSCLGILFGSINFVNETSGTIIVENAEVSTNYAGVYLAANAQNKGDIMVSNIAIGRGFTSGNGHIINSGNIEIVNTGSLGINVSDSLTNIGIIDIRNIADSGIENRGHIDNQFNGIISISSDSSDAVGIRNFELIINDGNIFINSISKGIINRSFAGAPPFIQNTGSIWLDSITSAVSLEAGSFSNGLNINIENCIQAIEISDATFSNSDQGNIAVNNCMHGLKVIDNGHLNNLINGNIEILASTGISLIID